MFFKLHSERKIGFKQLSLADLGLGTSHQTHIGLYGDIFTYLQDSEVEEKALLIYNNNIDSVDCYFDRIENPDGTYRSPKIRKGERNSVSVVTVIRDKAAEYPSSYRWFLIWFGLENEEMVFYFFNDQSSDYSEVSNILDLSRGGRIDDSDNQYTQLLNYLENKVNVSGKKIIEELEIASQVGTSKKYRPFDLENANNLFKETGKKGEEIIANYLDYQKSRNQIFNYTWYNRSMETGLPYDFSIQKNDQNVIFIDVKSTNFKFEQPLIFSNQEIECIADKSNYHIYRVFDLSEDLANPKLRICENSRNIATIIQPQISQLCTSLSQQQVTLQMTKMAIKPTNELLTFNNEILLNF
ncbi:MULTISPECIES: DUF3883 domain-containing protein [Flavobacterium]|uniref:DUF3883 domain-containing protein n=1 Tax=Flavobacterium keumense TaxID=1306518 RepID=A0ABY8N3W5_9FLAO|nr:MULTISPECIES: DUF3883 domain-containing protein [Flavobacterium]WGK94069.1 DUF3883 domain-containing protein [Flavobacterium keumense]